MKCDNCNNEQKKIKEYFFRYGYSTTIPVYSDGANTLYRRIESTSGTKTGWICNSCKNRLFISSFFVSPIIPSFAFIFLILYAIFIQFNNTIFILMAGMLFWAFISALVYINGDYEVLNPAEYLLLKKHQDELKKEGHQSYCLAKDGSLWHDFKNKKTE